MRIVTSKWISNSSRYLKYIKFFFNLIYFRISRIKVYLKGRFSISYSGRKLLFSRRRGDAHSNWIARFNYQQFTQIPSTAISFIKTGFHSEFTTLFYQASGLYFTLALANKRLFNFLLFNKNKLYWLNQSITYIYYLGFLRVNDFIYFISDLLSGSIFISRSFGSYSRIVAIDEWTNFFLVRLPSKQRRLFFVLTNVLLYTPSVYSEKYYHQKAGFYQNRTRCSVVRGVAMNPVDHPHGGRTKTIRCPLTPWGLPTK